MTSLERLQPGGCNLSMSLLASSGGTGLVRGAGSMPTWTDICGGDGVHRPAITSAGPTERNTNV